MRRLIVLLFLAQVACGKTGHNEVSFSHLNSDLVVSVGASTVATLNNHPRGAQGWGKYLGKYFNVPFENMASSGDSSKSYYNIHWQDVLNMRPGYILIQFANNDAKIGPRYTDPQTTFKYYLESFIDDANSLGAKVIFVTSPLRMNPTDCVGQDTAQPWREAMLEVAADRGIEVIDMYAAIYEWQMDNCANIHDFYVDSVHTNEIGAEIFADIVAGLIENSAYSSLLR